MRFPPKTLFLIPVLVAGLSLIPDGRVRAQTFKTLHSFIGQGDGAFPEAGVILAGNRLYGTTYSGGTSANGTVFAVNTDGTDYTNLHSFQMTSEGVGLHGGLVLSGTTLYGTASHAASQAWGAMFAVNTDGTGFTNLHNFTNSNDGGGPYAGLTLSGSTLYGATMNGGSVNNGTVFKANTAGTGFTILHSFTGGSFGTVGVYAGLILSENVLYGTTYRGGSSGNGTVFAVHTDGTGFTNLHSFTAIGGTYGSNNDGANPYASLTLSGNRLYGTAYNGGTSGNGTVFALNTNGTDFTILHTFTPTPSNYPFTNSDGAKPYAELRLSGSILYGTASMDGSRGYGTVFAVNTDGTDFMTLYSFTGGSDGSSPRAGLILSENTLYGTAYYGGSQPPYQFGTVFSLSLPPPPRLVLTRSGANVVLTWPTNTAGFTLQSTTNLVSPANWITNSPTPVVVNGQNTVTNLVSATMQFYRLSR